MKHLWRKDKGYDSHWYLSDFLAAIVAFALFITLLWVALPVESSEVCPEQNKVESIVDGDIDSVVLEAGTQVCIKGGQTLVNVTADGTSTLFELLGTGQNVSHYSVLEVSTSTTTTVTTAPSTTTTTEVPKSTTTTIVETTTTTEAPTTTTTHSSTTTTETEETSTTTAIPTTTEPPISPSTTVGSVEISTELPFTGFDPRLLLVGFLSVIGGTALLAKTHESS